MDDLKRAKEFVSAMTESMPELTPDQQDLLLIGAIQAYADLLARSE